MKSFKYVLTICIGLFIFSILILGFNFISLSKEKETLEGERVSLFQLKQKIDNEQKGIEKDFTLLSQEKEAIKEEKSILSKFKQQIDDERKRLKKDFALLSQEKKKLKEEQATLSELKDWVEKEKGKIEKKKCNWPYREDGTCMNGWNDIREIPCKAGYFNILKEGWGGAIGNVSYEEAVNWACHACSKGYYCPGDGHKYECSKAEKSGATECPK